MLLNTEAEVASIGEVLLLEFFVFDLESSLKNFVGLVASDGHMHGHLLVTLDSEASDSESGSGVDWFLS